MKTWNFSLILICVFFVGSCVDADPFGSNRKNITADYYLESLDTGEWLLLRSEHEDSPQGYVPGPILELGWDSSVLAVKRQYPYLRDGKRIEPDAWIVIDLSNHSVSTPITEADFRRRYPSLKTEDVAAVCSRL